jgi:hypothetical protein
MNEILTVVGSWTGILVLAVLAVTPLLTDLPVRRRAARPAGAVPRLPAQRAPAESRADVLQHLG